MLAQTLAAVASILVASGLMFQLVTLARLGTKIARAKRRHRRAPRPTAPVTVARPRVARRRARDYRTALRAAA